VLERGGGIDLHHNAGARSVDRLAGGGEAGQEAGAAHRGQPNPVGGDAERDQAGR